MIKSRLLRKASVSLLCLFFLAACQGDRNVGATALLQTFGGGCSSTLGTWTQAALQQTQALITTMQSVKDATTAACSGLSSALQTAQSIQTQIQGIAVDPVTHQYRLSQEKKQDLLLALSHAQGSSSVDSGMVDALRKALYGAEIELAQSKAAASTSDSESQRARLVSGLTQLMSLSQALAGQTANLSECFQLAPSMGLEVAMSLVSIGGSFATPLAGAAFATIGQLFSGAVSYLKYADLDHAMSQLRDTQMQTALTCAMESMSHLYCDSVSTEKFLDLAASSYLKEDWKPTPVWRGMDLLGKRLPILNDWLYRVGGGVDPQNLAFSKKTNDLWKQVDSLKSIRRSIQGLFSESKRALDDTNDIKQKEQLTRKLVIDAVMWMLYGDGSNGNQTSIIGEYASMYQLACILIDDQTSCQPPQQQTSFQDFVARWTIVDGWGGVNQRTVKFLDGIDRLVTRGLYREISPDPDLLLTEATQPGLSKLSPLQVLIELSSFFKDPNASASQQVQILKAETAKQIDQVIAAVVAPSTVPDDPKDPRSPNYRAMKFVFDQFNLIYGTQVITERFSQLIRWDMEDRVRNGELPGDLTSDILSSSLGIYDQVEQANLGLSDYQSLKDDIAGGQSSTQQNLSTFMSVFSKSIDSTLKALKEAADKAREPADQWTRGNRRILAKLCVIALSTSLSESQEIDWSTCSGARLESVFPDSGIRISFDELREKVKLMPYSDRVCVFNRFQRENRIYQYRTPKAVPIEFQ